MQNSKHSCDYLFNIRKHLLQTHAYLHTYACQGSMLAYLANEIRSINRQIASIKEEECKLQYQTCIDKSLNIH